MQAMSAPTVADARRAAEELAAAGVSRVLLFGSVARGDATEHSDIDLVAVFDDIDYSHRWDLRHSLGSAAERAVGHHVEVFVTDRPEWRRRTCDVSASFEAGIADGAVVLKDRPAGAVRWDKEIGLADNNIDEALSRVDEAAKALNLMTRSLMPSDREAHAALFDDDGSGDYLLNWRLMDICSAGSMAVEPSLKALAATAGTPAPFKHLIDRLVPLVGSLVGDARDALAALERNTVARGDKPYGDITIWRQAGTYIGDRPDIGLQHTSHLAPLIAEAAVKLAAMAARETASRAGKAPALARAFEVVAAAEEIISGRDLITGEPKHRQ